MNDNLDSQIGYCADLVTLKDSEAFPLTLLTLHKSADWVPVGKLCQKIGIATIGIKDELVVTWLPDPSGNRNYAVIIFFDDESKESFAANYNRSRFLDTIPIVDPPEAPTLGGTRTRTD